MFGNLKIRAKFLFVPAVVLAGLTLLAGFSLNVLKSQQALLSDVVRRDFVKFDKLSDLFSQLSINNGELFDLLAKAGKGIDEERLYELGKTNLNLVHKIIGQVDEVASSVVLTQKEVLLHMTLKNKLLDYRDIVINAVEMASVDVSLARQHIITLNQSFAEVNKDFMALVHIARLDSKSAITDVVREFDRRASQFILLLGLVVLLTVCLVFIISSNISREIISISTVATKLARGDTKVVIPYMYRKDELGTMAHAVQVFKESLFKVAESEATARKLNQELEEEIKQRVQAEEALLKVNEELEQRVEDRTAAVQTVNKELVVANQKLAESSKHKSEFLSNVSHELRTPLNSILGFTRIVLRKTEGQIQALQKENLQKVLVSAEHLLRLINGLLDLAKIEAGRMEVFVEQVKVQVLIDSVISTVEPLLKGNVSLLKEIDPDLPIVNTDGHKLNQIVLNLMSNAVKFTEKGHIKIAASSSDGSLKIVISDTGIGIKKEALEYIFEAFRQVDMSSTRSYGGTGLGLAIVKQLTNLLRGDITLVSEEGRGSKFTITLPLNLKL
jgi:signal transduction histidine kinase